MLGKYTGFLKRGFGAFAGKVFKTNLQTQDGDVLLKSEPTIKDVVHVIQLRSANYGFVPRQGESSKPEPEIDDAEYRAVFNQHDDLLLQSAHIDSLRSANESESKLNLKSVEEYLPSVLQCETLDELQDKLSRFHDNNIDVPRQGESSNDLDDNSPDLD